MATKSRRFSIDSGYYVYVGSAMNGLLQRIHRHLSKEKNKHWHIDFLLEKGEILLAVLIPENHGVESSIALSLSRHFPFIDGFGSSDSRARSHLFRVEKRDLGKIMDIIADHMEGTP
ncbi:MAG TPA: DUF123 domain-containing protein [Thermotogae bacterium]|nr:DUF123 domain-containing protein [Thermotogota bacterium]